jgi:hypothetical protein
MNPWSYMSVGTSAYQDVINAEEPDREKLIQLPTSWRRSERRD